jgi:ParB-like chromosome segregation protein Spo0J
MQLTESKKEAFPKRQHVPLELLDRMDTSRSLDEETIARLQASIRDWGLMQPLVVIVRGQRYLLCIGNHRCEAMLLLGEKEADCLILPEGTTREEALIRSLHENHVRHDESLPDIMNRLTALKEFHGCKSFAECAKLAGISESKVSRIRFAIKNLSPQALSVVQTHKVGWGIAYEVAKRAESPEEQAEWLTSHARGEMNRAEIIDQSKQKAAAAKVAKRPTAQVPTVLKPRSVRLQGTLDGVSVRLTIPHSAGGDVVSTVLTTLARRIAEHCEGQQPLYQFTISRK